MLVPRIISTYRSFRSRPRPQIRQLPTKTSYALTILFLSATIAFLSTLPVFHPENVFRLTQSRLSTPSGVLLTRLAALRQTSVQDQKLRAVFDQGGLKAQLLYVRYGPDVLLTCPFATSGDLDAGTMYFMYALPGILTAHLLHLFALGLATSSFLSGREGNQWRNMAAIAGIVLAIAEVFAVSNYNDTANMRSTKVNEIDFLYWKLLVYRGLAIAALDAALGWVIWLQATGRASLAPTPASERLLDHAKAMEQLLAKTRGLGVIRNALVRDADARGRTNGYWVKEGEVMRDVLEEPEVVEALRGACRRLDVVRVGREAEGFVEGVLGGSGPPSRGVAVG